MDGLIYQKIIINNQHEKDHHYLIFIFYHHQHQENMNIKNCLVLLISCFLLTCSEEDIFIQQGFSLEVNNLYMLADGNSEILLNIKQKNKIINPVAHNIEFYVNGTRLGTNTFKTTTPGEYALEARHRDAASNQVKVTARAPIEYPAIELQVIFHIVTDAGYSQDNFINVTLIQQYLASLNELFNNEITTGVTNPNKTKPNIFFRLAAKDPRGIDLEEPGINRMKYPNGSSSIESKPWVFDSMWDLDNYVNIWVGRTYSSISWANYPFFQPDVLPLPGLSTGRLTPPNIQGIVLTPGALQRNLVYILAHEIGHYLGLFHVFTESCDIVDADYCPDTLFIGGSRTRCDGGLYSAEDNIMDYHGVRLTFTFDQVQRMRYSIDHAKWRAQKSIRFL